MSRNETLSIVSAPTRSLSSKSTIDDKLYTLLMYHINQVLNLFLSMCVKSFICLLFEGLEMGIVCYLRFAVLFIDVIKRIVHVCTLFIIFLSVQLNYVPRK